MAATTGTASQTRPYGAYVMLFLSCLFAGGNYVAAKYLGRELTPLTGAALRFGLAVSMLVPWVLVREGLPDRRSASRLPIVWFMGLTGIFGFNALLFIALQMTTATNASLITASAPMAVAILSVPLLRDRATPAQAIGIIVSFVGVVYLVAQGSLDNLLRMRFNLGDLLVIGAVLSFAVFNITGKRMVGAFSPAATMAWSFSAGVILLALTAPLEPGWQSLDRLSLTGILAIVYMAAVGTVANYVLWYAAMARVSATTASIFSNVIPLSTFVWASILLGERLTLYVLVSACVVLLGVYLTTRGAARVK